MTIFGLNSPEIFILLVIFLSILGPKRIEKLLYTFPGFIKFLLSNEKNYKVISEKKEEEGQVIEKKEEEASVIEKKEEEAPNNVEKVMTPMKVIPLNKEGEQKVNKTRAVKSIKNSGKTKEKSLKKEKNTKSRIKKEIQTKKDKDTNSSK